MTPLLSAGGLAAAVALAGGAPLVRWLRRAGAIKSIREEAPAAHGRKAGTPTMGGVLIIGALLVAVLVVAPASSGLSPDLLAALGVVLLFAAAGGVDDALGILRRRNLGLRAREKLLLQVPPALLLGVYVLMRSPLGDSLVVPATHVRLHLGWAYPIFCALLVVGMANAVNLTDGLDGLAAGIVAKMELAVLIVGGLFVAEALSVILQVACFKATGRRLFRMSPFHHHFELSGWTETQTVVRFWICGALLAALGVGLGS